METDAILVQQTLSGDTDAFNHLVEKYQEEIFAISLSVVKNPEDARDIAQETFLQAYVNLQQLRNPDKFSTWLKKIAWNQSKKQCRQHGKKEHIPLESVVQEQDEKTPVDEKLVQQELFQAVLEAINTLSVKEQQVIRAYLDGKSYDEIGRQHGLSYKGATNRVYRAREKILRKIQQFLHLIFPFPKLKSFFVTKGVGTMKITLTTKILITLGCAMIVGFAGYGIITSTTSENPDKNVQGVTRSSDETAVSSRTSPNKRGFVDQQAQPTFEEPLETQPEELVEDEQFLVDDSEENLQTESVDIPAEIEEETSAALLTGDEESEAESSGEGDSGDIIPNAGNIVGSVESITMTTHGLEHQPIAGATISYTGPQTGSVTADSNGDFKISNLPPGRYTLNARKAGYEDRLNLPVTVVSGCDTHINIKMRIPSETPVLELTAE